MRTFIYIAFLCSTLWGYAQKPIELKVWPNGAPNSNGITAPEEMNSPGRPGKVSEPTLAVYPAAHPNGMAIIACPGGGYQHLAMNHEGHDMAAWFNAQGITYAVLKYRMPNGHNEVPLSDAQEAIRIMKSHAGEWKINPAQIGIMGASAGGHLASTAATHFDKETCVSNFTLSGYQHESLCFTRGFPKESFRRISNSTTHREIFQRTASHTRNASGFYRAFQ